jgi:hypothetical protein
MDEVYQTAGPIAIFILVLYIYTRIARGISKVEDTQKAVR